MFDNPSIVQAAQRHARERYPEEAVGFVNHQDQYVPLVNCADNPLVEFKADYIEEDIKALIHSHPNHPASPSLADMQQQQAMDVPWGIVCCTAHEVSPITWFGDGTPIPPYLGRTFLDGVRDCWSLLRHWHKQERGIVLPDPPRQTDWYKKPPVGLGIDLINDQLIAEAGFVNIDKTKLQYGDVVLGQIASPVINHCGVYVGSGLILHHVGTRLSCHEPVGRWYSHCRHFLRYVPK
jgi:proteasome lid subunit RPN8/RPN11